ncbi:MAG: VOC family protein [Planctomycetota bacterium]|nr:VOC family protein [Planctomycetota bacterium]
MSDDPASPDPPPSPVLRIARPSDDLAAVAAQYRVGLGLDELGRFEDHDGFDGIILGAPLHPWHLEFTACRGHVAGRAPTEDNLLVLYLPGEAECATRLAAMDAAGFARVPAFNPYWDRDGVTFEDLDGYRVVVTRRAWGR